MGNRLYVGNLSFNTNQDTIREAFSRFGEVTDVHLVTDRQTGQARGFGFVTMGTTAAAQAAIAGMNGSSLEGRDLRVNEAEERQGGGGGGEATSLVSAVDRRDPGKDPRVVTFRGALEALLESLDATVRIARWQQGDGGPVPEELQRSAAQLQLRLGSATRLAAGRFAGTAAVVEKSDTIKEAVRDLDAAFVAYRRRLDGPTKQRDEAALELDAVLGRVKGDAHRWE